MKQSFFRIALAAMCVAMCAMVQAAAPPISVASPLAVAYVVAQEKVAPVAIAAAVRAESPSLSAFKLATCERMQAPSAASMTMPSYNYTISKSAERQANIRHRIGACS